MPTDAVTSSPRADRDLAVAWMNRGHAALLIGDPASLASALEAYRTAISLLRPLIRHPDSEPSWANSLGAALMNFGELLHRLYGLARAEHALAAFDEADQVLAGLPAAIVPWAPRNLAGTRINRANLLLDLGRQADAAETARLALALVRPAERDALVDADLALKARRVLCEALGQRLVGSTDAADAIATEASDLIDDALSLVRYWHSRQIEFRELSLRFYRFGTQLYRVHQPHFLAEFIREHLPVNDAEFRVVAVAAARAALTERPTDQSYLTIGDAASERYVQTARDLKALLAEIS